ncbi:thiamine pyrophosphate-dependent enzyme, partial [Amylibacter sp.]|nr:thiamine pyrophosphate-dependent enzyme [Amylibacter sp.]
DVWRDELGHNCRTIRLNIDPENLSALHKTELSAFCCDAHSTLEGVSEALEGHVAQSEWVADEIKALRQRWRNEVDSDRQGIVPIADALRAALPEDTTIYSDMTQFAYVAKDIWDMDKPDMWHHPYGFGTLGYALPAAIGGKIGVGDAPVIAIAGDYGFQYTVQELGVAVELGLSLPIILWDNGKLKEIEDCMVNSQIAPNAVQALNPNFCKLAEAWGANSAHPKTLVEMQDAVKLAFKAGGPTLIYVTPEIL